MEQPKLTIFRFNFKEEIMSMITEFAQIHQNDDRKKYKEEWTAWFNAHNVPLEEEIARLTRIGYIGNIEYKMFNAGRYYFRKKNNSNVQGNAKSPTMSNSNSSPNRKMNSGKQPKLYISTDKTLLSAMDEHILRSMNNEKFTPADGYNEFCNLHKHLLGTEIKRMYNIVNTDGNNDKFCATLIIQKIKKTYKNRYYIITRK